MKLRRQKKPKHSQAADAVASVTKIWSEWQLGKKASKGVAKAKSLRPPGKIKKVLSGKWVKVGGAVAVAGGTAAAVGKKLKGDDPETYTGPPPSAAVEVPVTSPSDPPPPLVVAPDPATQERDTETVGGSSTLRANRDDSPEPAADPEPVAGAADAEATAAASDGGDVEPVAEEPTAATDPGDAEAPADIEAPGDAEAPADGDEPADAETT
jgi:hypothetical protein